jgi:hypothetical protein
MNELKVDPVTSADFSARAIGRGRTVTCYLRGDADMQAQPQLHTFLTELHAEAERLGILELFFDFRELEFMTSSCFKEFVTWANKLQSIPTERRYRACFLSDPKSHWQKRSLMALSRFANDVITVQ